MKKLIAVGVLGAVLMASGCASAGEVVQRSRCKTSLCIIVRQDDGKTAFSGPLSIGSYPACVVGARWPDCQKRGS